MGTGIFMFSFQIFSYMASIHIWLDINNIKMHLTDIELKNSTYQRNTLIGNSSKKNIDL